MNEGYHDVHMSILYALAQYHTVYCQQSAHPLSTTKTVVIIVIDTAPSSSSSSIRT